MIQQYNKFFPNTIYLQIKEIKILLLQIKKILEDLASEILRITSNKLSEFGDVLH